MSKVDLILALKPEIREQLESIAAHLGRTVEECAQLAIGEFIENWNDYMRTITDLESGEEARPVLRAVND